MDILKDPSATEMQETEESSAQGAAIQADFGGAVVKSAPKRKEENLAFMENINRDSKGTGRVLRGSLADIILVEFGVGTTDYKLFLFKNPPTKEVGEPDYIVRFMKLQ